MSTKRCSEAERKGRATKAHQFNLAAEMVETLAAGKVAPYGHAWWVTSPVPYPLVTIMAPVGCTSARRSPIGLEGARGEVRRSQPAVPWPDGR